MVCSTLASALTTTLGFALLIRAGNTGHQSKNSVPRATELNPYALSEVVIQPQADIVSLSYFRKRQDPQPQTLKNNVPSNSTINPGGHQVWIFPASELAAALPTQTPFLPPLGNASGSGSQNTASSNELKRQTTRKRVFFSLDVCNQPAAVGSASTTPPPISLWISQSANNKDPGPGHQGFDQSNESPTYGGHADYYTDEQGDTYIGVSAPSLNGFTGGWTYQLSASTVDWYTPFEQDLGPPLHFVDSDPTSAFFRTGKLAQGANESDPLLQQWVGSGGAYSLFVYNASDPMLAGVNRSFCGLTNYAAAWTNIPGKTTNNSETGMKLFDQTSVYQSFYVPGLQRNSSYKAALALKSRYSRDVNSNTPRGGGTIWPSVDFHTHYTDNCRLVYNLSFCDEVAYSVPSNATMNTAPLSSLAGAYDNFTNTSLWSNFQNSLAQIPCNTSNDAKYSLARGCDDCQAAYKSWVCAVSIPRCADVLSTAPTLKLRNTQPKYPDSNQLNTWPNGTNVTNDNDPYWTDAWNTQARNFGLASYVNISGAYKEVLPCIDLCNNLVQSCPSSLGFACPIGRQFDWGYVQLQPGQLMTMTDGYPQCNFPGRPWALNSASTKRVPWLLVAAAVVTTLWCLV